MAYGIVHAATGTMMSMAATTPVGIGIAAVISFLSHYPLDDINMGQFTVFHGDHKWLRIFRVIAWLGLVAYLMFHPWYAIGAGMACIIDLEHIWGCLKLHNLAWKPWTRTPKAISVWFAIISMMIALIWL